MLAGFLHGLLNPDFWIGVGITAGIYAIFTLGLQLNAGFTGLFNFGQAGFMAIGAYAMALLVVKLGWPLWLAFPAALVPPILAGLLIGLPTLRLRADYFAIATLALAEIVRYVAQNASFAGGNQGLLGYDRDWRMVADWLLGGLAAVGLGQLYQLPLLVLVWGVFVVCALLLAWLQRTPWGRVLRAVREDEDAARALGKNVFLYKLQSLALAAATGAIAGYFLALNVTIVYPVLFEPTFTFLGYAILVLGGLASYRGVAAGSLILWTVLEGTRLIDLPLRSEQEAALRFMIIGLVLILVPALRPQGLFGRREEMLLRR